MTPVRAASLVRRWVGLYTRRLPDAVARRRIEEVAADLHDHIAHEQSQGISRARISASILSRMARGMPADVSWRRQFEPSGGSAMKPLAAILVAAIAIAVIALALDSPIVLLLSVAVVGGATLLALAMGIGDARRGNVLMPFLAMTAAALVVAALAVYAIVWGSQDDAPGLVLWGTAVITSVVVGAFALGMRTAQRRS